MRNKELSIKHFLSLREKELKKAQEEMEYLRTMRGQKIRVVPNYPNGGGFYSSDDYNLANHVKIQKKHKTSEGWNDYSGGYESWTESYFPKFSYIVSKEHSIDVAIGEARGEPDFFEAIFCAIEKKEGWKDFTDETRAPRAGFYYSIDDVVGLYEKLGVNEDLLRSFKRKANNTLREIRKAYRW